MLPERNQSFRRHGKQSSVASTTASEKRASVQQVRRSVVDASQLGTPILPRHSVLGHRRIESKEILLTDLEFWTALVSDYTTTANRLPTLTTTKIRAGIPHPLRGLVWQSIAGARDTHLEGLYAQLSRESSPYEKVIGRDLARTFPDVDMFRHEDGDGQLDLGKVLRAFSLYDNEVGYCQGLGFIVAPLLMNMSHGEAFCVLVRLMEAYEMRLMYTPTLAGLKLRLWQFEKLIEETVPLLATHLNALEIYPAMYASQWFLSLFAVTCPLQTLHRVYDVFLSEGPETMMRVGIALLVKNQDAILSLDMEEVLSMLLGKSLWQAYEDDDSLIADVQALAPRIDADTLVE
ncbi:rab-GTPase-TBC domain-domain-containing protein, partial [Protomyces lactucae-debilis]